MYLSVRPLVTRSQGNEDWGSPRMRNDIDQRIFRQRNQKLLVEQQAAAPVLRRPDDSGTVVMVGGRNHIIEPPGLLRRERQTSDGVDALGLHAAEHREDSARLLPRRVEEGADRAEIRIEMKMRTQPERPEGAAPHGGGHCRRRHLFRAVIDRPHARMNMKITRQLHSRTPMFPKKLPPFGHGPRVFWAYSPKASGTFRGPRSPVFRAAPPYSHLRERHCLYFPQKVATLPPSPWLRRTSRACHPRRLRGG